MFHRVLKALAALCGAVVLVAHAQAPALPAPLVLRFDIQRFVVEGNTLLPKDEVQHLTSQYTGKQRDFGDVQRALEALENAYRSRGYSAVQVYLPEQNLEQGTVHLKVIEARLRTVEVRNNKFFDSANVRSSLPSIRKGEAPNSDAMSSDLRIANENPAKQTTVLLRAGDKEGDVDAVLDVKDENPQKVFATLDNTGSDATGKLRFGLGYQNANLFNRDHALTVQVVTSDKPDRVAIYSAGYHLPLYGHGASMDFVAGYSDVDVGTTATPVGPLQFSGRGSVFLARYNRQLWRIPGYEHKLSFGIDHRDYHNTCTLAEFGPEGCGSAGESFAVTPLSLTYSGSWTLEHAQAGFYLSGLGNVPAGSRGEEEDLQASRPGTTGHYGLLRFGANYAKSFEHDWQARVAVSAQYTDTPLVAPEQFAVAGMYAVRGFLEREVANDRGYLVNLEAYTPDIASRLGTGDWSTRLLVFYDAGQVSRVDPLPGDTVRESISSAGVGARVGLGKTLSLRADLAQVLDGGSGRSSGRRRLSAAAIWVF